MIRPVHLRINAHGSNNDTNPMARNTAVIQKEIILSSHVRIILTNLNFLQIPIKHNDSDDNNNKIYMSNE
jgi:hypothetical protein